MSIKVLAVDDDKAARLIYQGIARKPGFDIVVVENCFDALGALRTAQFDVILMDWRLPDIDGMECTRMIREREKEQGWRIPIIAVTAYAMIGDREECLAAGVDDYLSKPIVLDELAKKVESWARRVIDWPNEAAG